MTRTFFENQEERKVAASGGSIWWTFQWINPDGFRTGDFEQGWGSKEQAEAWVKVMETLRPEGWTVDAIPTSGHDLDYTSLFNLEDVL